METWGAGLALCKCSRPVSELRSDVISAYLEHRMDTLPVETYHRPRQLGGVTLEFFNDRLYEVDFARENVHASLHSCTAAPILRIRNIAWIL